MIQINVRQHGNFPISSFVIDLSDAVSKGEIRIYQRGGENSDRDYDIAFSIVNYGNTYTLNATPSSFGSTATLTNIIGYK